MITQLRYEKRGMFFERLINQTIDFYKYNEIAILHKKSLDITFAKIKNIDGRKMISNGYIKNKVPADYYGIYKGKFIAFEAKSTNLKALPLKNIKAHQLDYLWSINHHNGIAFLLIHLSKLNRIFIIFINSLQLLPKKKKSIPLEFMIKHGIETDIIYPGIINFISLLKT